MDSFKNSKLSWALLILLALLAVAGLLSPILLPNAVRGLYNYCSYWIMTLILLGWVSASILFVIQEKPELTLKTLTKPLILSVAAVSLMIASLTFEMKTNSDEANLLSVANSFYWLKEPLNITEGKFYFDVFHPIHLESHKRPLFFSYLISVFHNFNRDHALSPYTVNLSFFFLFLVCMLLIVQKRNSTWLILSASTLSLLAQPIVMIFASSSGFDFLSALLLFSSLAIAFYFFKLQTRTCFFLFMMTLTAFSHVRYENPILAVLIFLLVLLYTKSFKKLVFLPETFFFGATFSIHIWQRFLMPNALENPPDVPVFAVKHFIDHLKIIPESLIRNDLPYNVIIFGAFIVLLVKLLTQKENRKWFPFFAAPLGLQLVITLSYYFGFIAHPSSGRFFIPMSIACSLVLVFFMQNLKVISHQIFAFTFCLANFVIFYPNATESKFINTLTLNRDIHYMVDFIKKQNTKRLLVIWGRPVQFTALGYGAISIDRAKNESDTLKLELNNGLYDHVYLFEETTYSKQTKTWGETSKLFRYVTHFQQFDDHVMMIYELKSARQKQSP